MNRIFLSFIICHFSFSSIAAQNDTVVIHNPKKVTIVTNDAKIYIPLDELVDRDAELKRLNKELEQLRKRLAQSEGKLNNQGFTSKAPAAVVEGVRKQAEKEKEQIALIEAAIAALK